MPCRAVFNDSAYVITTVTNVLDSGIPSKYDNKFVNFDPTQHLIRSWNPNRMTVHKVTSHRDLASAIDNLDICLICRLRYAADLVAETCRLNDHTDRHLSTLCFIVIQTFPQQE